MRHLISASSRCDRAALVGCLVLVLGMFHFRGVAQVQGEPGPAFEIRGTVIELGVSQPVAGADVFLIRLPSNPAPRMASAFSPKSVAQTTTTSASGDFIFIVKDQGDYKVEVYKEGYRPSEDSVAVQTINVTEQDPKRQLSFILARSAELSGRLIDEDTKRPIVALPVFVVRLRFGRGKAIGWPAAQAITNAEGDFVAKDLPPGDYLLRPASRMYDEGAEKTNPGVKRQGQALLLTDFSERDLKAAIWDYEQSWFPGGSDLGTASPVTLGSGAAMHLGDLPLRKRRVYSAKISIWGGTCAGNSYVQVNTVPLSDNGQMTGRQARAPCRKEFLLRGFPPGSYRIEAAVEGLSRDTWERGSATFDVVDENVSVWVPVSRGVNVEGKILVAEGATPPDFAALNVRLTPLGWVNFAGELSNPVDDKGAFRVVNVAARDQWIQLSGLTVPFYIKEVRHNGRLVSDGVIPLDVNATAHVVEIVVDDKPATIWGTVASRGRPASTPKVTLVRWPLNRKDPYLSVVASVDGDKGGNFSLGELPAGEYRLFAVASAARAELEEPGVLERLASGAQKITVAERGFQNVRLELVEMR